MNYEEVKISAKEKYEMVLKEIEFCKEIADKIEPSLPDGWDCRIDETIFNLYITKGWRSVAGTDAGEFKLVCKLVENVTGEKLNKNAQVNNGEDSVFCLHAEKYIEKNEVCIGVNVSLYHPENMPDCKIEWKRKWRKEAVISDECLGISQGAS